MLLFIRKLHSKWDWQCRGPNSISHIDWLRPKWEWHSEVSGLSGPEKAARQSATWHRVSSSSFRSYNFGSSTKAGIAKVNLK